MLFMGFEPWALTITLSFGGHHLEEKIFMSKKIRRIEQRKRSKIGKRKENNFCQNERVCIFRSTVDNRWPISFVYQDDISVNMSAYKR